MNIRMSNGSTIIEGKIILRLSRFLAGAIAITLITGFEGTASLAQEAEETEVLAEYDDLQSIFLELSQDTSEDDIKSYIDEYELSYTQEEYNGQPKELVYQLAYTNETARQSYGESGDYLSVTFNRGDGSFMYAEYYNDQSSMVALFYNYGTYWDFGEEESGRYTGYYYYVPGKTKGGIKITYSNGNSTETGYHSVSNAKKALEAVIDG